MTRPPPARSALLATLAAAVLIALLPAALVLLAGAPTPEQGLSPAAVARDVSAAALDRLDRLLQGEWAVALDAPARSALPEHAPAAAATAPAAPRDHAAVPAASRVLLC